VPGDLAAWHEYTDVSEKELPSIFRILFVTFSLKIVAERNVGCFYQTTQHTTGKTVPAKQMYWLHLRIVQAAGINKHTIWRHPATAVEMRQHSFTSCKQEQNPARRELGLKVNTKRQSKQQPCESQRGVALVGRGTDRQHFRRRLEESVNK
jgi:hypothetical protein